MRPWTPPADALAHDGSAVMMPEYLEVFMGRYKWGFICRVARVIIQIRGLLTPLRTTHEPPSISPLWASLAPREFQCSLCPTPGRRCEGGCRKRGMQPPLGKATRKHMVSRPVHVMLMPTKLSGDIYGLQFCQCPNRTSNTCHARSCSKKLQQGSEQDKDTFELIRPSAHTNLTHAVPA